MAPDDLHEVNLVSTLRHTAYVESELRTASYGASLRAFLRSPPWNWVSIPL